MSTFYPSIYDNAYKYNTLQNNSIVITTETGFADVAAVSNTVLICNENGQWVTSSLDNYATSTDITNIQNSINTLSTYDDILQQSISINITAINTLQTNLTNNYFTKTEITDNLSNYVDITTLDGFAYEFSEVITTMSNDITTISNNVQILTDDILHIYYTFDNLIQHADTTLGSDILLEGTWKLYGTVTLYITDITLMTPTVNTLTEAEWVDALPIFEITFEDNNLGEEEENRFISVSQEKIESNRPLLTIPINALTTLTNSSYNLQSNIILPSWYDINIRPHDIRLYKYDLYLERISGYKNIEVGPVE